MSGLKHPDLIRSMDSLEEFFWLLRTPGSYRYTGALTIEGATTVQQWRAAWTSLHAVYEVLTASIVKEIGRRPVFTRSGKESPLNVEPRVLLPEPDSAMATLLNDTSQDWDASLMRGTLFHHPERCMLIITANHCGSDGSTCTRIIKSVLEALTGRFKPTAVQWLSPSAYVGRETPAEYRRASMIETITNLPIERVPLPPLKIISSVLDIEVTQEILKVVKYQRCTVQSALLVAFAVALKQHSWNTTRTGIRCSVPIDIRSLAEVDSAVGVLISMYVTDVTISKSEMFWPCVQRVQAGLNCARELSSVQQRTDQLNEMMSVELTPETLEQTLSGGAFTKDMTITNLGRNTIPSEYGHLSVSSLSFAVHSGRPDAQTICVHTMNDKLTFTQVSRLPIPDLLEQIRLILVGACM